MKEANRLVSCFREWTVQCERRFQQLKANEEELNRIFIDIYGLQDELTPEVEDKDVTVRRADLGRDIRSLSSYAVGCMFGRYSLYKPGLIFAGELYSLQAFVDKMNDQPGTVSKPALGAVMLCELQPHMVQRFLNNLQRSASPLSAKTVKNVHGVLSKALAEAMRIKYLPMNPATGCILPKATREEIHPLEAEEITRFMEAIKGNRYEALFFVAINTGMRISELLGLRWSRVDFKKGTIKVDVQLLCLRGKGTKRTLGPTKNSKPRTFRAAPAVMECLRGVERQQKEWRLRAGNAWDNPLGLVFTTEAGSDIPHINIERHFNRVLEAAGIGAHRFHDLRHTFTVEGIKAGIDVKTLSAMLGHSSVAFTLDVYGHVTQAMQDEAAARLQAVIQGRNSFT